MSKKTKKTPELQLNTKDAKVAGVASGIAEYYHQDPAWVRLLGVVFIILSGIIPGLIIYGAFYALMKRTNEK